MSLQGCQPCQGCHILAALRMWRKLFIDKQLAGLSFLRLPNCARARAPHFPLDGRPFRLTTTRRGV
jgi:hypothetical protein